MSHILHLFKFIITRIFSWIFGIFNLSSKRIYVDGFVEPQFEGVKKAFEQNFITNWEFEGGSLTVFHKGKKVVDLWGGYADKECSRRWKKDTISIAFSTTKAVAALCVAVLVDQGLLNYEDKIIKFWPEFGKHGKDEITVQWILSHLSGLAYFDQEITEEIARDGEKMGKLIEEEVPKWPPGKAVGYHAMTYGWLVDQIIRKVDPKKRSLGQFYRDEIQQGSDFHIGLRSSQAFRVARLKNPSLSQRIGEFWTNPRGINYFQFIYDFFTNGIIYKITQNPRWLQAFIKFTVNNPEFYTLEQGASMGIGNGRSLAEIFNRVFFEKTVFQNPETFKKLTTPFIEAKDLVIGNFVPRGQGLFFPTYLHKKTGKQFQEIGHAGLGGQNVRVDLKNELSIGYVANGMKTGLGESARTWLRLQDAVYDSVLLMEKQK